MKLPDFLIIGAMKAGTTTLWSDLRMHPAISMDAKEPGCLCDDEVLNPEGMEKYASFFARSEPGQLCGDASTSYAKRPSFEGVAERALRVLGEEIKAIYLVREPVSRAVSQHYHIHFWDNTPPPLPECRTLDPLLIEYSRYAMQLEPWIEAFGRERVRVVVFEEYVEDRCGTVAELHDFLGLPPRPDLLKASQASNRTAGKPLLNQGLGRWIRHHPVYRRLIRPVAPARLKEAFTERFLPKAPPPSPPTLAQVDQIIEGVRDDAEQLQCIMGRPRPLWDFAAVRRKYEKIAIPPPLSGGAGL